MFIGSMQMQTLVPAGTFEKRARRLLGDTAFNELLVSLARRPKAGHLIRGTGGLRKIRVARPGGGKSGGARVVYYFHDENTPILLLLIYAKADQENLTAIQKEALKKRVLEIIEAFS